MPKSQIHIKSLTDRGGINHLVEFDFWHLTCLFLLQEGTTPTAEIPALLSGQNCPALLKHPLFSLIKVSYVVVIKMLAYITVGRGRTTACNTPMGS